MKSTAGMKTMSNRRMQVEFNDGNAKSPSRTMYESMKAEKRHGNQVKAMKPV